MSNLISVKIKSCIQTLKYSALDLQVMYYIMYLFILYMLYVGIQLFGL